MVTRASVYGDVTIHGIKADYRIPNPEVSKAHSGLSSVYSNILQIKQPIQTDRGSKQATCRNSACKILNVDYFNQAVDENGKWEQWPNWHLLAGGQSCGASSSVMVADYFKKLPQRSNHRLKSYVFQDNSQNLANKKCPKPGAFAVTSYNSYCNQSGLTGIGQYLTQQGLKYRVHWIDRTKEKEGMEIIKKSIDNNRPIILSYTRPIGHILVVKGYTYNNQLVVNDPYRDIQNDYRKAIYDYSGRDAIYSLHPNSNYALNYLIEVYP